MKLLLTSGGISNASIHEALVELLGKPVAEATALCIPTAAYAMPGGPEMVAAVINGSVPTPLCELGWKSLGVLELTALPSIEEEMWAPVVQKIDALLVAGGDPMYLCHWMRNSGLAALFPSMPDVVYVGVSAGSMVMAPKVGREFVGWTGPAQDDVALGVVEFSMFPHLDNAALPDNTMAAAEAWAAALDGPAYALDDQTALSVVDGSIEVVSEGHWRRFEEV